MDSILKPGKKYCVTYYLSLADTCIYGVSSLGVYFSVDTPKYNGSGTDVLNYTPQVTNLSNNFILDKINWVPMTGEYTAVGGEQFITIGNFNDDANTVTQTAVGGTQPWAYYYIDDVFVTPEVGANAGSGKQICRGKGIIIGDSAVAGATYFWQPSIGLSDSTISNPAANPTVTTTYTLTITYSGSSCTGNLTDTVSVVVNDCSQTIFVPSGFSPNGDGKNDILLVQGDNIQTMDFIIYDRWGEKVFETASPATGWDGTFIGKKADTGVYVYYLKGKLSNGEDIIKNGNITLLR